MPNVNYRGKLPSQDPNMPPESGVTSIPLGAPWPPLSREQIVKLHQALVAFRGEMEASKGIRSHEDQQDMIWGAAVELDGLLVELGIGSPPPTRTWTHEEIAKVAEEVQEEAPKRNCWTCKHSLGERGGWLCNTHNIEVLLWLGKPENNIGLREDGRMMPERTTDGCPGWEPKIVRHNCMGCAWRLEPNGEYPLGACLLPYSHAHREAKSAWLNSEAARVLPCPARKEVNPSDAVASLERWMKGGKP